MNRSVRLAGFLLIAAGVTFTLPWFIEPLRGIWPWLLELPLPLRIGIILAAAGALLLFGSLLWERWEDSDQDRLLREEEL